MSNISIKFARIQKERNQDYTILKIAVNKENIDLLNMYKNHINSYNNTIMYNSKFPNSGFDLFFPEKIDIPGNFKTTMVSMEIKCEMIDSKGVPCGFYIYPRSSISKTPLLLANHVGIIDSGYRGNLIAAFKSSDSDPYSVDKFTRLLQITNHDLTPILVEMVNEDQLSTTERGEWGFGSTGV